MLKADGRHPLSRNMCCGCPWGRASATRADGWKVCYHIGGLLLWLIRAVPSRRPEEFCSEDYYAIQASRTATTVQRRGAETFKAPPAGWASYKPPAGKAGQRVAKTSESQQPKQSLAAKPAGPPKKAAPPVLAHSLQGTQQPKSSATHLPLPTLALPLVPKSSPELLPAGVEAIGESTVTVPALPVSVPEGLQLSPPCAERAAPVEASASRNDYPHGPVSEKDREKMTSDLIDYREAVEDIFYDLDYNFAAENALELLPDGGGRVAAMMNAKQTHNVMAWFIRHSGRITNADGAPSVIRISCYTYDFPQLQEAILHARNVLGKEVYMLSLIHI